MQRKSALGRVDRAATSHQPATLEMIAAYFAPTWADARRIGAVGQPRPGADHHRRQSDNNATIAAARHTYRRLLRRGVEISNISRPSSTRSC